MPREVYPLPDAVVPNSKVIEELASEGIEVVSIDPFVAYVRSDVMERFPNEDLLKAYVLQKLQQVV